ncbi:hypothetical protein PBY51_024765 [Eleginops maclovinus]|uniref:TGF-beta family profile domain-containing protein n=1 Tax=Eleginops maclovinus TaxID=56733 RepID=A0AAN8AV84_ELEMC|nr:hypothetical protein PBY51_024765 [Eleginops maclovinus]
MMSVDVFCCAALMLCCSRLCVALQLSHGQTPARGPSLTEHTFPSTASTASHPAPLYAMCFVEDIFAVLRESVGDDDELINSSVSQFGICTASERASVLLQLAKETRSSQRNGLEVLQPTGVIFAEENQKGALLLTFDLPQSPLLKLNPVLLLAFESPLTGGIPDVTFTSQSLHPNTQSVCISEKTQYIMLTGKALEGDVHHKWRISVETKQPDMNQSLRDILIGGKSGSTVSMTPFLLFSGEGGTETRYSHTSSPASSQTPFLCELKRFLGDVPPQAPPESLPLKLDTLQSLPPLMLGLSSSDTLLAGLINSSSLTIFSFTSRGSMFQVHRGELALSPDLLQEVKQRLQQTVTRVMEFIENEGEVDFRVTQRLQRLTELSALPEKEPAAGESQYRAFLLLRALQTVVRAYEMQRSLRSTRDSTGIPASGNACGLKRLTVSLKQHLMGPTDADINNCQGSCTIPQHGNNHAVLLNDYINKGNVEERAPCCVPIVYGDLEVMQQHHDGTYLSTKPDIVAMQCGCR